MKLPRIEYPAELPVSAFRDRIVEAVRSNPVTIVCGDTGSGKTTQIPKMVLEALAARERLRVACTQPRRLAAVTMAERVADEMASPVGGFVGYQHRYARQVSSETGLVFMTDGVLLARTRTDPLLRGFDAIVVDEAHERSLNVDFLLGILKRVLARRRDLRVVVSSATLDTGHFAEFFDNAPVVDVPGRLFPVEMRYRSPEPEAEGDLPGLVSAAVAELPARDDVLVFLPGERDIRECAEHLAASRSGADEIIPLLASLPAAEQRRAFRLSSRRRIVLATNVAETSVTIPGIRCVVDSGLARISRYVHRTQVQRLQIENISQASARQRAGRCGRLGPGVCIRLYSEEDFLARDVYTAPEVLRSSLAGVILTMLDLGLGDVESFPFLDPPKPAMVREGLRELVELGAIAHVMRNGVREVCLTAIGRKLARIPIEPRLARMLLAAVDEAVLDDVLPVVAAMACDDPRRRPADERDKAQQAHAQFREVSSDFLGTLKLWRWWCENSAELSQSKLRTLCKKTYLSYPRMREWRDLVRQLGDLAHRLGISSAGTNHDPAEAANRLHRALLTGLLSRIGHWHEEDREYRGAHGLRFALHPGSALAKNRKTPAPWIMAGELVDTARLFARDAAGIDPAWIERAAGPLCRHSYRAPEYDPQSGFVRAVEQITLYGLVVVPSRRCDFSRVNLPLAREMFIRGALVGGEFPRPPPEVRRNCEFLDTLRRLAEKLRRPEVFDAERLTSFFAAVLPEEVASADALRKWLRRDHTAGERLALRREDWWPTGSGARSDYPDSIMVGGVKMRLSYRDLPDDPERDGITCSVKRSDAAALGLWRADWLVPGALPEKLSFMLSVLPSALRRVLSPLDETVATLMAHLRPGSASLEEAVREVVYAEKGFRIPPDAWAGMRLPPHLRVRYCVRDDATGRVIAASRDLGEVLSAAGIDASSASGGVRPSAESDTPSTEWTFGVIPASGRGDSGGWELEHFPALHDEGNGVTLRLYSDAAQAASAHAAGVTRLFALALARRFKADFRAKGLPFASALYLGQLDWSDADVANDIFLGAVREAYVRNLDPVRDGDEFARRLETRRDALLEARGAITDIFRSSLVAAAEIESTLQRVKVDPATVDSVRTQLAWLVYRGFPRLVPLARLREYPRYLRGAALRLERARVNPASDLAKEARFEALWRRYREAVAQPKPLVPPATLTRIRWMLEEYRISVFAQELGTPEPVSPKRIEALWDGRT